MGGELQKHEGGVDQRIAGERAAERDVERQGRPHHSREDAHHFLPALAEVGHDDADMTAKHLRVVKVESDDNLLLVRGAVPGPTGGYLLIRKNKRAK